MMAQRATTWPVTMRDRLAYERNRVSAFVIMLVEFAPSDNPRSHCLQKARRYYFEARRRFLPRSCRRLPLRLKENISASALRSRRIHSRNRADLLDQVAIKRR